MTDQRQASANRFRIVVSILIVGHLLAVFLPPLSLQARGPLGLSPAVATVLAVVERYSELLYLDRGYAFFAPDPGPSHLLQAAITDGSGGRVEQMFPDRNEQWPRLLYHRHFMLSEYLQETYQPPGPSAELVKDDPEAAAIWVHARARYEHVRQSMVEHLKHQHPGKDVAIRRIEHLIPNVIEFQREPVSLTDPRSYVVLLDQPIDVDSSDNLAAPDRPPEAIPTLDGTEVNRDSGSQEAESNGVRSKAQDVAGEAPE